MMTLCLLFRLFFILCAQPPTPLTFFPPIVNHTRKCLMYFFASRHTSLSSHRWLNTLKCYSMRSPVSTVELLEELKILQLRNNPTSAGFILYTYMKIYVNKKFLVKICVK
jgi:hypothetical protein